MNASLQTSFLLIGHRATGKSTLGRAVAERFDCPFWDVDDLIEQKTGRTAADLVRMDVEAFRTLEEHTLADVLRERPYGIYAAGAGLRRFPTDLCIIWIDRDGWEENATTDRAPLRSDLPLAEEFAWMHKTRTPRYRETAHARLRLERGCSVTDAAGRLATLISWLNASVRSPLFQQTWMVPRVQRQLSRCLADVLRFGLRGVEIRSDVFPACPEIPTATLASLRTDDASFFPSARHADVWDCDIRFLHHLALDSVHPRPLILSVHAPDAFRDHFDALLHARDRIGTRYPAWSELLEIKYAPLIKSWPELRFAWQLCSAHERTGGRVHFLPQGKRWRWMRIVRGQKSSHINYVAPGCTEESVGPPGLEYFLPCAVPPRPSALFGVIGDPVEHSRGDTFHRAISLERDQHPIGYVKIPVRRSEIDFALHLLPTLGVKNLSVTSPLKSAVAHSNFVGNASNLPAGNTLRFTDGYFALHDTDEEGVAHALGILKMRGITPGPVAVFGSGDVSFAVTRACERSGWSPITRVSARSGWPEFQAESFQLIINASGASDSAQHGAPSARAWIDLHYSGITRVPDVEVWLNGTPVYEAQALAQRRIWGLE